MSGLPPALAACNGLALDCGGQLKNHDPKRLCRPFKKLMGNLQKNTDAVARLSFGVLSGPVFQILYNFKRIFHSRPALFSFNIHDCSDSAVIMFKFLPV